MIEKFWLIPFQKLVQQLYSSESGLNKDEAKKRKKQYGSNIIAEQQKHKIFWQFITRFKSPFIVLLLCASLVSAFLKETHSAIIIFLMVILSVGLDFFQEYRSNKAAQKLRQSVAHKTTVLRQGKTEEILATHLVPGDIVILSAGDLIPADGRVFFSKDLFINQALLTGESFPVEKTASDLDKPTNDLAPNAVFMGSSVVSGRGHMIVCNIGKQTFFGETASILNAAPPPSSFELSTIRFGYFLMSLTVVLALFVFIVNLFLHKPLLETALFTLALSVGITPEFLPMIMSVTLARGSMRMAKKKVIVKHLSAIHDLGMMDILCTDKTGTLTEAKIQLADYLDINGEKSEHVLIMGYLNSYFETGIKSPLDQSILSYKEIDTGGWEKIDEIPFDFERRRVSVLLDNHQSHLLIVKGATENIINICSKIEIDGQFKTLNDLEKTKILKAFESQSQQGFRVLSVAWREAPKDHLKAAAEDESDLIFAGFLTFLDPPKKSALKALKSLSNNQIAVKIITGDNEHVTKHLCEELDIPISGLLKGEDIETMSASKLEEVVQKANIFCRMTPSQKTIIIGALKKQGHIVGFLGDGINDAPALHLSDVGISIDTATDIAKEAADLILLEHSLHVINAGVIEGRRTYGNIMKYIMMVTSSNFGNMLSMAGASLIIPFLPMQAPQILLNNLLYDFSEMPIPLDHVDDEILRKPHQWSIGFITKFMLIFGPISSAFDFLIFYIMLKVLHADEHIFQTGWFIESLSTQILVIFVIRTSISSLKSRPHPLLVFSSLFLIAIGVGITLTPIGAYFEFVKLSPLYFFILVLMIISYLVIAEFAKRLFYKKFASRPV